MQESNLETFKTAILGKVPDNQLAEVWINLLTQLIEDIERYQSLRLNKSWVSNEIKVFSSNLGLFKIKSPSKANRSPSATPLLSWRAAPT